MYLDTFLTEYDDTLSSELNIDPLGLQIIWSAFGQAIFKNRINSISNDVRNYTVNLFHHYVIKNLIEDDSLVLGKALQSRYADKNELNFKYACLIHLENLLVYSMISRQQSKNVETAGVLGISKARHKWHESGENPILKFGHGSECQVLVRQVMLGVSGRYKTPLTEMKFFDRDYHYDLPESVAQWEKAEALIKGNTHLSKLFVLLRNHFGELIQQTGRRGLEISFSDIEEQLKSAYVKAFASPAFVGSYAKEFWLNLTELDKGAAGAIYEVLHASTLLAGDSKLSAPALFALAERRIADGDPAEKAKLTQIRELEPFLSELDLMFTLMLTSKNQTLKEVSAAWTALGRDEHTLPHLSAALDNEAMFSRLSQTGKSRLRQVLKVAAHLSIPEQLRALQAYHGRVMESRGQLPWVQLRDSALKLDIQTRRVPSLKERGEDFWVNSYYIPQFKNLLRGLWGVAA